MLLVAEPKKTRVDKPDPEVSGAFHDVVTHDLEILDRAGAEIEEAEGSVPDPDEGASDEGA
ncbi:hypothetical protein [Pelagibius sp.]|uniref:hypothetical protein n=1 Tax=Pelagibius sp. TaxID=1931238 RepID=UPI0026275E84|nr:hypothetical protein [Pelagibius sp.]